MERGTEDEMAQRAEGGRRTRDIECARAASWGRSSGETERWPACEQGRSGGSARREPSGAFFGGQAPHEAQRRLVAVRARHGLWALGIVVDGSRVAIGEQELELSQCGPLGGVEQTEGAHAVQTGQRHVLEEAAQKLVGGQRHGPALAVAAVLKVTERSSEAVMALSESAVRWT